MRFAVIAVWIAYEAVACLFWPALYAYYLCRSRWDGKYAGNYRARMGLDLPGPSGKGPMRVWIHALSVGETLSTVPLVRELKSLAPHSEIFFSTTTETGMSVARKKMSSLVDTFFFMPHDFPWAVNRIIRNISPALFVLIETDFWPNLLRRLKKEGVRCALVNGRMSPSSYRKYAGLGSLAAIIFNKFDLVFTQTDDDKVRFESLGGFRGKAIAAGNLKYESSAGGKVSDTEVDAIRAQLDLDSDRPVWVAGSTHPGEEEILLRVHGELKLEIPQLLLIIAPRNIGRGTEILALCDSRGFACGQRSRGDSAAGKQVYVLDTLGELVRIYALAKVAFIGGSLGPFGGHNPLEPVAQGKPACWGPHFFNFGEIEKCLLEAGCAERTASEKDLTSFLRKVLKNDSDLAQMEHAAECFAGFQRGIASTIASELMQGIV